MIARLAASCNPSTITDGRGAIFTYLPQLPILEWNLIFTNAGSARGMHYHLEFDEYVLIVAGVGVYRQLEEDGSTDVLKVSDGDCIHFPAGTPHALHAITDVRMVALLTKPWDECDTPATPVDMP